MKPLAVEMRGIVKKFPRVVANDGVDLSLKEGEIHALVGENGAGKSTLMKLLYGMMRPDFGSIKLFGEEVSFDSPLDAIAAGIGMVHQHFMLVPPLTVAENVVLGQEPARAGLLDRRAAEKKVAELSRSYGLKVDAKAKVADLSVGLQQRVEILKVLYRGARILILDEPTAVLTPQEVDELLATLRSLRDAGSTIVLITHKLREVKAVADGVTVMRQGRSVAEVRAKGTSIEELSELMIGRKLKTVRPPEDEGLERAPVRLQLEKLSAEDDRGLPALKKVDLEVRGGEILGIAGVEGNGQTELEEVLAGLRVPTEGRLLFDGSDVSRLGTLGRIERGFSHIPSDRHRDALLLDAPIHENLLLGHQRAPEAGSRWRLDRKGLLARARKSMEAFDVRPRDVQQNARALSGGNQQKVVIARETSRRVNVLVACHPTRGVDLGAAEFIYEKLLEARRGGAAVVLISSELSELLQLSDRIAVLYEGKVVGEVPGAKATETMLGRWMTGAA